MATKHREELVNRRLQDDAVKTHRRDQSHLLLVEIRDGRDVAVVW
jgi:hypothetical protein